MAAHMGESQLGAPSCATAPGHQGALLAPVVRQHPAVCGLSCHSHVLRTKNVTSPRCNCENPCVTELTASVHPGLYRSCSSIIKQRTLFNHSPFSNTSFSAPSMSILTTSAAWICISV